MGSSLFKFLLVGGSAVTTAGALPNIFTGSLVSSGIKDREIQDISKVSQSTNKLFNGHLKYEDGRWNFKKVCFYYKGKPGGNQMNIVGYATGWGIGSGCNTLRSHVDKNLPTVEFSVDLSTVKSDGIRKTGKTFASLYMGSEGLEGTKGQILGCVEVDWWKNGGVWNGQEVVVGDLFRVDEGGCVSSTFKSKESSQKCNNSGPCRNAWQAVEKKSGQKWDDVWTKDLDKAEKDGKKYAKLWTNNATWRLEQR